MVGVHCFVEGFDQFVPVLERPKLHFLLDLFHPSVVHAVFIQLQPVVALQKRETDQVDEVVVHEVAGVAIQ